ncbi:hypothetical protein CKM354_000026700 [Cercospora kikuchii]|uniref:F-box domain-containing protein n=1 Tax=Cercospora kikuchii TaxID=84275 RepID=A0A9P3CAH2_9PEZI|nr:uncharacterized protein CKM354_000026700 [Cercospora kikuchii]GIZ36800.1 hypothetical protein CKM354_000026700 [Cercospora kikuchii]
MSSQSGASHRDDGLESSVSDAVTPCQTHFKFLDLPTELRLMISEFVLFSDFEERKAISKEPLAHPLYYVSHEMQAEVESTYIKALYNYSERVRLTVNEATDKLLSLYSTSVKHSKALLESMNAGSMTSEER